MIRWVTIAVASLLLGALPRSCFALTKIACVGTSITAGGSLGRYPDTLQRLLGTARYQVGNFGSAGKCVLRNAVVPPRDNVNGPYWYTGPFYQVFGFNPNVIIMEFGAGDSRVSNWTTLSGQFVHDYCDMIDTFYSAIPTHPRIFVCRPTPCFDPACCDIQPAVIQNEILSLVDSVAALRNLTVIDLNTPLLEHQADCFSSDNVHPNGPGFGRIARIVFEAISASSVDVPVVRCPDGKSGTGVCVLLRMGLSIPDPLTKVFEINGSRAATAQQGSLRPRVIFGLRNRD